MGTTKPHYRLHIAEAAAFEDGWVWKCVRINPKWGMRRVSWYRSSAEAIRRAPR